MEPNHKGRRDRKKAVKIPLVMRCIFWEPSKPHTPLDREHIWGEWLKPYVRSDINRHRLREEEIGKPGTLSKVKITPRTGEPLLSKVRIVCKACNSGWMSRIQSVAKPFLLPLIQGRSTTMGLVAQRAIAAWCTMATITSDYLSHDNTAIAISQGERDWFRDNGTPPQDWKIWIGHYTGRKGRWTHFVVPILEAKGISELKDNDFAQPNTQTTTFVVGNLFVHVISTSGDPSTVSRWIWPSGSPLTLKLVQIAPTRESIVVWPPQSLTDFETELISTAFERVIDGASRSLTGRRLV
jgi:hypothetical protein